MANLGIRVVAAIGFWIAAGPSVDAGPTGPRDDLAARLRAEADSIDVATLSPLFRAILAPGRDAKWPLPAEVAASTRVCGELTRDVLRGWLVRDLDADPPLPLKTLADRLASPGRKLRERVVRHAEAVVIEAILPTAEVRRAYAIAGRKPEPFLAGRYGPVPIDFDLHERQTADSLRDEIEMQRFLLSAASTSPITEAILNRGEASTKPPARRSTEPAPDAIGLIHRLKSLTSKVLSDWVARGVGHADSPPRAVLVERAALMDPTIDSVLAHVDAILLEAVLPPELAEEMLRRFWKDRELEALRDPILAHRLRLTRDQRDRIDELIRQKRNLESPTDRWPTTIDGPLGPELQEQEDAYQAEQGDIEAIIRDGLTANQARTLGKILGPGQPKPLGRRPPVGTPR